MEALSFVTQMASKASVWLGMLLRLGTASLADRHGWPRYAS
jgi:hypothetical protein